VERCIDPTDIGIALQVFIILYDNWTQRLSGLIRLSTATKCHFAICDRRLTGDGETLTFRRLIIAVKLQTCKRT
jgi:hypothetical protein